MATFADKLAQATIETEQVNPLYTQEITKGITRVSNGTARLDSVQRIYTHIKTDGIYRCYYISDTDGLEYNFLLQLECKLDTDLVYELGFLYK